MFNYILVQSSPRDLIKLQFLFTCDYIAVSLSRFLIFAISMICSNQIPCISY